MTNCPKPQSYCVNNHIGQSKSGNLQIWTMEGLETGNKLLFLPFLKYHHFSFHHINYSCSLVFSLLAWPPCNRAKNKRAILKPLSIQHPPKMMWQRSLSHVDIIQVMSVCSRCFVSLVPDANCWLWRNVAAEWYLKHQLPAIKINMLFRLVNGFFFRPSWLV